MRKLVLILFLVISFLLHSQDKLTVQNSTFGRWREFAPKSLVAPAWMKNQNAFTYLSSDYQSLMVRSEKEGWKEKTFISTIDLRDMLRNKLNIFTEFNNFPTAYEWFPDERILFTHQDKKNKYVFLVHLDKIDVGVAFPVPMESNQEQISPKGNFLAYTLENNIYIVEKSGKYYPVTNDIDKAIVNGSDFVHRQEFGIKKGMWWSPKEDKLLYYRKDERMVDDYPLVNTAERIAKAQMIKYPMAGLKSEEVSLCVYDLVTAKSITLQTGQPAEQYLTSVTWSPDGQSVFVGVLNREQNHLKLNQYDAVSGAFIKTLFEEKANTYVEPLHPLEFVPGRVNQFLYRSEREGFDAFYLYSTDGKLLRSFKVPQSQVMDFLGFDATGQNFFFTAATNDGLDRQVFRAQLTNGRVTQITTASGTHNALISSDGKWILDSFSDTKLPNVVTLQEIGKRNVKEILFASNPFTGKVQLPKMELVKITAADGKTPLNGRIIYPLNFDTNKKYPVIVYVYGGPHAQMVTNSWLGGASLFDYYLAQEGYIVFTLDNRGSDARGRDFEHVIHRRLGQVEMQDQMEGVKYLKSLPFVDGEKIGVYGWSFGGFMTISLMLNYPDVFKVGVAGGPVCDWKWYEVMYGERYMDTPDENPDGYKKTSVLEKANDLQGKLLVIHGAQDDVVVQQHSLEFIKACIKAGKQVDYFVYPDHKHNVSGRDRIHLNQKIADYFFLHLR